MHQYETLRIRFEEEICFIQLDRPQAHNTINGTLIEECLQVLGLCERQITTVVLEGSPTVFCLGADFRAIHDRMDQGGQEESSAEQLYRLWLQLATGPYVTIAHVRGRANAGGVGFVAACDVVLARADAEFSLSEMLFGLFPACVMPFLVRRVGVQRSHYLTVTTKPVDAVQALSWGLADAVDPDSEKLLRSHLRRLRCLSKGAIVQYKQYASALGQQLLAAMPAAISANEKMFSDSATLAAIHRYVGTGRLPWES